MLSKENNLQKLFDLVVKREKNLDDEYVRQQLKEQKMVCLINWPEETREIIKKAHVYYLKQSQPKLRISFF